MNCTSAIDVMLKPRFYAVTHVSTAISLFCCLLMAVSGYLVFTSKTEGNILNNFPADDLMVNIARFCFGVNMSSTSGSFPSSVSLRKYSRASTPR